MATAAQPVFDPQAAWEALLTRGLSKEDAARHVLFSFHNQPEDVRRQYLKEVDPGALASFGLGAADMMSFGLGDQIARGLEGKEATDTQQAALQEHHAAHTWGEAAGLVGPAAAEYGLAKAGVLVPTVVGRTVAKIGSRLGRGAAKTAVNAAMGAGYAGAQAAGHTEGGLAPRAAAAGRAAPLGALVGAALPLVASGTKATVGGWANRWLDNLAGKAPAAAEVTPEAAQAAIQAEMGAARPEPPPNPASVEAVRAHEAGEISAEEMSRRLGVALGQSPSAVAPTVPVEPPRVSAPQPIPGSPKGISAVGPPTPPAPTAPTVAEMQPRATGTPPIGAPAIPGRPDLGTVAPAGPFQRAGPATRTASPSMPSSISAEASAPLAQALGQFEGGGFGGVSRAMQHPAYQSADVLARQAQRLGIPAFKGMSVEDATAALRNMIVEHAAQGGEIPPITTLPKFLERLAVPQAVAQ